MDNPLNYPDVQAAPSLGTTLVVANNRTPNISELGLMNERRLCNTYLVALAHVIFLLCSCYVLATQLLQEHVWGMDSIMDGYLFGEMEDYEAVSYGVSSGSCNWVGCDVQCTSVNKIGIGQQMANRWLIIVKLYELAIYRWLIDGYTNLNYKLYKIVPNQWVCGS